MARGSSLAILEVLLVFVLVFTLQFVAAFANLVGALFVLSPPVTQNPWTIVTSVYAHSDLGHLLSNSIGLVLFGLPVAYATTKVRFHLFFIVTGGIAGISHIVLSNALAAAPVVGGGGAAGVLGASGAVFALLGYLLAGNRVSSRLHGFVPPWLTYTLFLVVAVGVTVATAAPGVALIAHFVGLLVGLVAGKLNLLQVSPPEETGDSVPY